MKSFKVQLQIGSLLRSIVDHQRQINSYRKNLLEIVGFTPYFAFGLVDVNKNKYITNKELYQFLKSNNYYKSEKEISDYLQFRTQNETLLSYNEFTQLVQSHPKQVVDCSLEVQNTASEKIKSALARFFDLLIQSHAIIKKLKKDIITGYDLDYYELQLLLDPHNHNNITYEKLKEFMEECSKPFQQEDLKYLIQHISLSSERLKFKDFVNYMSNKKVTSVVITNRSRSNSPHKENSRHTLYDSLRDDSISPNQASSFMNTQNSLQYRSAYDQKYHDSPSKHNNQTSIYIEQNRHTPSRVYFDKSAYSHASSPSQSYHQSPQQKNTHQKNLSYTQHTTQIYSPNSQIRHQQAQNLINNNSYLCANCSSSVSPQKQKANFYTEVSVDNNNNNGQYQNNTTALSRKSPMKNEKFEPSLFKDPSIYYKKEDGQKYGESKQFQDQCNVTLNNMTRINKEEDYSNSKIQLTNIKVAKKVNNPNQEQDTINLSPREYETALKTGYTYQTSYHQQQQHTPISPLKHQQQQQQHLQQSGIYNQLDESVLRQSDSLSRAKYSQYVRNTTTGIVDFLSTAKNISAIEEEIEDSKKQLARNLSFSPINLFKAFDSEGQNYLRYSKFCELLSGINIKFNDSDITLIFSRIETDKDGFISQDEFNEVFKPCDADYLELFKNKPIQLTEVTDSECREIRFILNRILDREKILKKMMQQLKQTPNFEKFSIFSALDENQDGQINLLEFAQSFRNYNILLKQSNVKLLFNLMDIDRNGLVRYAEFLEFIQA